MQSLRKCLAELEEKAEKAEPLMRLGSPEKLAALVTRNVSAMEKQQLGNDLSICGVDSDVLRGYVVEKVGRWLDATSVWRVGDGLLTEGVFD